MFLCNNFKYSRVPILIVFCRLPRPIRICYKSCRISFFEHYDNSPSKLQFPVTFYCSQVSVAIKCFDAMIEIMIWNVILWLLWRCKYIFFLHNIEKKHLRSFVYPYFYQWKQKYHPVFTMKLIFLLVLRSHFHSFYDLETKFSWKYLSQMYRIFYVIRSLCSSYARNN